MMGFETSRVLGVVVSSGLRLQLGFDARAFQV